MDGAVVGRDHVALQLSRVLLPREAALLHHGGVHDVVSGTVVEGVRVRDGALDGVRVPNVALGHKDRRLLRCGSLY